LTLPSVHTEAPRVERQLFETRPNVSILSVSTRDLESAPRFFAEADVLRSLQLMPGVEARNDYTAGMNVRGGEADQNLVLLDGYPVYNPFHFGGLFGTFIDPAVGRVDARTAGFPAQFGGRLSSIMNVRSTEDDRAGFHGTSEVSLIASTLSLGGALGAGGSWLVAGRRTYADQAINLVKKKAFPYHFFDLETHVAHTLPEGFRVALTGYGGDDLLHFDATNADERQRVLWGNRVVGATLSKAFVNLPHLLGDSAALEQRVSPSGRRRSVRRPYQHALVRHPAATRPQVFRQPEPCIDGRGWRVHAVDSLARSRGYSAAAGGLLDRQRFAHADVSRAALCARD